MNGSEGSDEWIGGASRQRKESKTFLALRLIGDIGVWERPSHSCGERSAAGQDSKTIRRLWLRL